jgi:3D-(3,5/4)-trihydroxycyclohexane-1,2-dione acylhydrolase (decyclizing)
MEKKIRCTVGEAVVRFLDNQYVCFDGKENKFVEGVFTIFGHGCVLGIGEALAMCGHSLKVYQGKNEQGMAHAAVSFAKQHNRRKIMPCISSIGPGAANMVTAAAMASVNNIPLLLLPGDIFATRRPDPVLQQLEQPYDLNITTNDAFKPVSKFFDRITRPEMLESALQNAMRVLLDPADTGAVTIAMPQDVQAEVYPFPARLFDKKVHTIARMPAPFEELEAVAAALKSAKRPLIIVGGGARYSEAGEAIGVFCTRHHIPFAETQAGKSAIEGSNPFNLGGLGVTGNAAANAIARKADFVLGIGTRFSDFTTASRTLFRKAKIATVNVSAFHGNKLNAIRARGDAKLSVQALDKLVGSYRSLYKTEIEEAKALWEKEYKRLSGIRYTPSLIPEVKSMTPSTLEDFRAASGAGICQTAALALIRRMIAANAIVVGASGSLPGCMQRMWTTDARDSYNMEYGYSCMGYEIAGALGSKLAEPSREVYAMVGDGSYLMLHSEMVTAVQEGIKINILLFDNGGFGCINNLQMGKGIKSLATEFRYGAKAETPYVPIDYAMSARAYGFVSYTAKTLEELEAALAASLKEEKPVLIDIKVLPKTMTDGYEGGWWQVGCTRAPRNEKQKLALEDQIKHIDG